MDKKTLVMLGVLAMLLVAALPSLMRDFAPDDAHIEARAVPDPAPRYSVLSDWKPNNEPMGYGADILLEEDIEQVEESDLVDLIRTLSEGRDPVALRVYLSRIAYEQSESNDFGDEFKSGYILYYVKNGTRFDEIRWFQEVGKFSAKNGTQTKF